MRRYTSLCAAAALLTACEAPGRALAPAPAPQFAASTSRLQLVTPFDVTVQSTCHGELVRVQGAIYEQYAVTFTENGSVAIMGLNGRDLTGVGLTSGDPYRVIWHAAVVTTRVDAMTTTTAATHRLIKVGSGDDEMLRLTFHLTLNANGVRTVLVDSAVSGCIG